MTWVLEEERGASAPSTGRELLAFLINAETALQGSRTLPPHSLTLPLTQMATGLGPANTAPRMHWSADSQGYSPGLTRLKARDPRPPVSGLRRLENRLGGKCPQKLQQATVSMYRQVSKGPNIQSGTRQSIISFVFFLLSEHLPLSP